MEKLPKYDTYVSIELKIYIPMLKNMCYIIPNTYILFQISGSFPIKMSPIYLAYLKNWAHPTAGHIIQSSYSFGRKEDGLNTTDRIF